MKQGKGKHPFWFQIHTFLRKIRTSRIGVRVGLWGGFMVGFRVGVKLGFGFGFRVVPLSVSGLVQYRFRQHHHHQQHDHQQHEHSAHVNIMSILIMTPPSSLPTSPSSISSSIHIIINIDFVISTPLSISWRASLFGCDAP